MFRQNPPIVVVFAATDPTGGAGIYRDCRTLAANHCRAFAVVTAVTAQNLNGVQFSFPLPAAQVQAQCESIYAAHPAAIKIGVIGNAAISIAKYYGAHPHIVWDPVIAPTAGKAFMTLAQQRALCRRLLPHVFVMTPNCGELLQLANESRVTAAVAKLRGGGADYVLVTDINAKGKTVKHALFGEAAKTTPLWEAETPRRAGVYHGSGCFFSSTLTAALAHGKNIVVASQIAHDNTVTAIKRATALPSLGEQLLLD